MGHELIRAYLSELDTALAVVPGSARARAAIVAEISDGLADALTDHLDRGWPPAEAEQRVIDEFGDAALVATQFVPVLTAKQVHRSALILLRTGPLVGALWLATALLAVPLGLPIVSPVTITAAIMVAVVLVTAVPCSVFAVTVTGYGIRWWPVAPCRCRRVDRCGWGRRR
jgi:predicted cobalt transporter CbtA